MEFLYEQEGGGVETESAKKQGRRMNILQSAWSLLLPACATLEQGFKIIGSKAIAFAPSCKE